MELKAIVIHKLEKKQGHNAKLSKASKELTIQDTHKNFMKNVREVYYNKSNPIYGVFDDSAESYPFQNFLKSYLNEQITFLEFTNKAVTHFEKIINEVSQSTGGYVLFCHFHSTDEFIMTLVLNDKESYGITDSLDLTTDLTLDIEKLDVANFTNCTRLNNKEDTYLSFTKGKKTISNYFKKFIGCTDYTSAKDTSENLKKALGDYFMQNDFPKSTAELTKATIYSYCEERMKNKEDISLDFISSLVNHNEPESFKKFAITEEYQVSATFKGHSTLKSLKYLSYHSKDLVLEFDRKLLETKQVIYDATKNTLLIKQVPVELIAELSNKN